MARRRHLFCPGDGRDLETAPTRLIAAVSASRRRRCSIDGGLCDGSYSGDPRASSRGSIQPKWLAPQLTKLAIALDGTLPTEIGR